jgi:hypothetical protein
MDGRMPPPNTINSGKLKSLSRRSEVTSVTHANNYSMEVRSDPFESAKSHFFDTSSWGEFCDVTLTLKQSLAGRSRWLGKDQRLSVQTSFSTLHEPP